MIDTAIILCAALWPLWWVLAFRERRKAERFYKEATTLFERAQRHEQDVGRTYKEMLARFSSESYEDDPR